MKLTQTMFIKKIKRKTTLLILGGYLFAFNSCLSQESPKHFEGRVIYNIEFEALSNNVNLDKLKSIFGDKMIYTFKNGFGKKEYYSNNILINTRIYNPTLVINSKFGNKVDTVYQYHPYINEFPTKGYLYLNDSIIDNKKMKGVKVIVKDNSSFFDMEYTYFFDGSLSIDSKWFEKFKEGEWNRITKEMKSLSTYYIIQLSPEFIIIYKADKIESQSIKEEEFNLPNYFIKNID